MLRTFTLAASMALLSGLAAAAPITYNATLADGVPASGSILAAATPDSPLTAQYYRFFADTGASVTVWGERLQPSYDMSFWLFRGEFTDTTAFGSTFDSLDSGFIAFGDDEIERPGPFGDPLVAFVADSAGYYTVAVTNFMSGPTQPGRSHPFELFATGIGDGVSAPQSVPEPASLALAGLGLLGLAGRRRPKA